MGAGHTFLALIRGAFPINMLNVIKNIPEVVSIYCATANPVRVFLQQSGESVAVLVVSDGLRPVGFEGEEGRKESVKFLRELGYEGE